MTYYRLYYYNSKLHLLEDLLALGLVDHHVQVPAGLLQILDAVLGVMPTDILDDVTRSEGQAVLHDEGDRLDLEAGVVVGLVYVVSHFGIL